MTFDNFTIKAQQAVQHAIDKATGNGSQAVGAVHLLAGVLSVGENVTQFLFGKRVSTNGRCRAPLTTSSRAIRAFQAADNHIWTMMPTRCCKITNHRPKGRRRLRGFGTLVDGTA